ncbi:MAG: hypothetical protein J6A77_12935 [Lachnospiraceae bacterium]|nr:hypothetical protein [Lachnospiraceae bacterium]
MKKLTTKVMVPFLVVAMVGIICSIAGTMSLRNLGNIGDTIAAERVPAIIALDSLSAKVQELQQLLLTHSVMDTKESNRVWKAISGRQWLRFMLIWISITS